MADNLKIDVVLADVGESGVALSNYVTKDVHTQDLSEKADLVGGKVKADQLPAFSELNGVTAAFSGLETTLRSETDAALVEAKVYADEIVSNAMLTKADLVSGRVPAAQATEFKDVPGAKGVIDGLKQSFQLSIQSVQNELRENYPRLENNKIARINIPNDILMYSEDLTQIRNEFQTEYVQFAADVNQTRNELQSGYEAFVVNSDERYAGKLVETEVDNIIKNGASLPYNPSIQYLEGSIVRKDGELKQLIDGEWVSSLVAASIKTKSSQTQQDINDKGGATWYAKSGGYNLNDRVILDNGDEVISTELNNTIDPNEIEVIKPNTYGWFNETLASKNLYETQTRLLDFIPRQYHAEIFAGNSTRDFSSYINYAVSEIKGDLIFPRGVVTSSAPLLLERGIRFLGNGPFDTVTKGSSRIKLLDGSNCALIQTPSASGVGSPTHYMALENLIIDGNNANQTQMSTLMKMYGMWIGSWIRNVFVMNSYGTAFELDAGADLEIDHLWISGSVVGEDKYAFDTNPTYAGSTTRGGMLNINHLYVENTAKERYTDSNDSPRNKQTNRGDAIRFHALTSLNANEIHLEACRRMIDIKDSQVHRFGKVSAAHVGLDTLTDQAIIRVITANIVNLAVDNAVITTNGASVTHGVRKAQGLTFNAFPNAPLSGSTRNMIGYTAINSYTADGASVTPPLAVRKTLNVMKEGGNSAAVKLHDSDDLAVEFSKYSGIKLTTNGVGLYSTLNQVSAAEKVLLDIYTPTDSNGDAIRCYAPLKLSQRTISNNIAQGSIFSYSTSQGVGIAASITASTASFLVSVLTGSSAPSVTPSHIGQEYIDVNAKKVYKAVGISSAADWTILN